MKKLVARVLSLSLAAAVFGGCGGKTYEIYTNIPANEFEVTAKNFSVKEIISGGSGTASDKPAVAEDVSAYTAKSEIYYASDGTQGNLVVYADFTAAGVSEKYNALCGEVYSLINDFNYSLYSHNRLRNVSAFNDSLAGETVEIGKTAYEVLEIAQRMYKFTEGYYNPAVYYNVKAYGFSGGTAPETSADLPKDEVIAKYNELSSHFVEVEIKAEDNMYFATKPAATVEIDGEECSLKIDLGGIGKGYIADKIYGLLEKHGFNYGYFNFGSSSYAFKSNCNKSRTFNLGFVSPRYIKEFGESYIKSTISNVCLSTSGDYVQYYELDGVRYCHVINPKTGKPVQTGIMTVTVIGGSAAEDDALSTAIMAMEKDAAINFIKTKIPEKRVVFTYDAGVEQDRAGLLCR